MEHSRRARSAGAGYSARSIDPVRREETLRPKTVFAWLAVLLWTGLIWNLGGDGFSMNSTSRFLGPLLAWLVPDWSPEQTLRAQVLIRKAAHIGEYGVLCLLIGRALALTLRRRARVVAVVALLACAALATTDELRQGSSSLRTGSWGDVALDISGALVALGLLFLVCRALGRPMFGQDTARPERA